MRCPPGLPNLRHDVGKVLRIQISLYFEIPSHHVRARDHSHLSPHIMPVKRRRIIQRHPEQRRQRRLRRISGEHHPFSLRPRRRPLRRLIHHRQHSPKRRPVRVPLHLRHLHRHTLHRNRHSSPRVPHPCRAFCDRACPELAEGVGILISSVLSVSSVVKGFCPQLPNSGNPRILLTSFTVNTPHCSRICWICTSSSGSVVSTSANTNSRSVHPSFFAIASRVSDSASNRAVGTIACRNARSFYSSAVERFTSRSTPR